jgi:hypothetical protein
MTCSECRDLLVADLEGVLDEATSAAVAGHVRSCAGCADEAKQTAALQARLNADGRRAAAEPALAPAVMERIFRSTVHQLRRRAMLQRIIRIGAGLGVAAAVAVVAFLLFVPPTGPTPVSAAEILADGARAAANLKSVHITARMRSLPGEDIEFIGPDYDFIPVDLWKQWEPIAKWKIEKPGRTILMDGKQFVTYVEPTHAGFRHGPISNSRAFWLAQLLDVDHVLDMERQRAKAEGAKFTSGEERPADGKRQILVTIEAKAQGDFSQSDWLKNRTISMSDNRRVYRFDAETKRLQGLDVYIHVKENDVLIFQIMGIDYDPALDEAKVFALKLPDDVRWLGERKADPRDTKYAKMTPKEVAAAFFDALGKEDWDEVNYLFGVKVDDRLRFFGGAKVVSLGEPFKSGLFPGYFVPYEIQLKTGQTHKFNLSIRNDNAQHRWNVDGGL